MNDVFTEISCDDDDLPRARHRGDAGYDLRAAITSPVAISPGCRTMIPTGVSMALPRGYCAMVCSRSGLAASWGVAVANAPGIVDSSYRGEVNVILVNHGIVPYTVHPGDRIAQLVFVQHCQPRFLRVTGLDDSGRGDSGFGSTGK